MAKYFLHTAPTGGTRFFWRSVQSFAGVRIHINLNLLATAVGDVAPTGTALVAPVRYNTREPGLAPIELQPFVRSNGSELAIGTNLKNRLDYPLGGTARLSLSLPFYDPTLGIGDSGGGWFRPNSDNDGGFHGGWDVTPASQSEPADLFDVCAAADGVVRALVKRKNAPIVLEHQSGSAAFLTIYQHLDLAACPLNVGDRVGRGQWLAKITDEKDVPDPNRPHFRHLHFTVAVEGPSFVHRPSGRTVPPLWYAIDPFGVYDDYRNRSDLQSYNYLPDRRPDCFTHRIQGAEHVIQWAAQSLVRTIPKTTQTSYRAIARMQFRARRNGTRGGVPPRQVDQCLVWLEGIDHFFFVPFDRSSGRNMLELEMIDFLRQCFDRNRKVKLEHYPVGGQAYISAVWAND